MKKIAMLMAIGALLLLPMIASALGVDGNPPPIPEPTTLVLLGTGVAGLALWKMFKK